MSLIVFDLPNLCYPTSLYRLGIMHCFHRQHHNNVCSSSSITNRTGVLYFQLKEVSSIVRDNKIGIQRTKFILYYIIIKKVRLVRLFLLKTLFCTIIPAEDFLQFEQKVSIDNGC
jgi:hypothetical protein